MHCIFEMLMTTRIAKLEDRGKRPGINNNIMYVWGVKADQRECLIDNEPM